MNPKDQARQWLDQRCGRTVHVETHFQNSTDAPLVNEGPMTKVPTPNPNLGDVPEDRRPISDLYRVGTASYNLSDLPDDIDVHIRDEPDERLELTFDDGSSSLMTVRVTVITDR